MAFTLVQSQSNSGTTASLPVGSTQGWAAPTAGNLLVAFTNSNLTATAPTGFSAGPSVVDGNGAYVYYKIAAGTETTITFGNGASATNVGAFEYSGVAASPFDVQNSASATSTFASSTPSVSATTTVGGDLVVAFALTHNTNSATLSAPSWTNSFTNRMTTALGGTGTTSVQSFVADLTAGAAGAVSTVASWTNTAADRQALIIAFKAGAAATAATPQRQRMSPVPIIRAANF